MAGEISSSRSPPNDRQNLVAALGVQTASRDARGAAWVAPRDRCAVQVDTPPDTCGGFDPIHPGGPCATCADRSHLPGHDRRRHLLLAPCDAPTTCWPSG